MREFKFDKLVRDNIAESVLKDGGKVNSKTLNDREFLIEVKKKLLEETQELLTAVDDKVAEELSDVQELIELICDLKGLKKSDLKKLMADKARKVGAFKQKVYIDTVEVPDDSRWIDYYLSQPDRYPEVK